MKATHYGKLTLGAIDFEAVVCEGGARRLLAKDVAVALGGHSRKMGGCAQLARMLGSSSVKPFVSNELWGVLNKPDSIDLPTATRGARRAAGFDPRILVDLAGAIDDADRVGALGVRHAGMVAAVRALLRSLAGVGLTALIDEATGYTAQRPAGDLHAQFTATVERLMADHRAELAARDAAHMVAVSNTVSQAVSAVTARYEETIAAKDRRIDALCDSQATLAHAFADQVKAGSRALTTYRDSPELAALDREYHRRHDPTSDLFGSPHGPDATYEALKARALEALRNMTTAGPVFARRLPRELACVLAVPRRHARDVVGDLYADGAIRRRAGQIVVAAPAAKQVAGGANGVNRVAAVASGNGNGKAV